MKSHKPNYEFRSTTEKIKYKTLGLVNKISGKTHEVNIQTFQNIEIAE